MTYLVYTPKFTNLILSKFATFAKALFEKKDIRLMKFVQTSLTNVARVAIA